MRGTTAEYLSYSTRKDKNMDYNVSYRKKDGSIQCIISYKDHNGKWRTKSKQGFKTQKESKPWQKKTIEKLEEKLELNSKIKDEYKEITLKEFKRIYLRDIETTKSYNTFLVYKNALNKFKALDDEILIDLQYVDIKNIALKLIKEGYSADSVRKYISVFSTMLKVAKDEYEIITSNPLQDKKVIDSEKKDKKINALTKAQSNDLLKKMYPHRDYMITLVGLHTGMRVGEIAGLTTSDIDFKNQIINVNKQWKRFDKGYDFGKLKSSNSYRKIPLSPLLHKELQNYIKVIELFDRRIFPENTNNISERLNYRFKRLGFDISIHDLRHTYATTLLANGVDIKTVAEFMGDNVQTIIKTYIHFTDDMLEEGKEMIKNIF